jgi:hypothetical protein
VKVKLNNNPKRKVMILTRDKKKKDAFDLHDEQKNRINKSRDREREGGER